MLLYKLLLATLLIPNLESAEGLAYDGKRKGFVSKQLH